MSDTFTRADGAGLGTSETGQAWAESGAQTGWSIATNQARPPVGSGYSFATVNAVADVDMTVTVDPRNSGADLGIVAKFTDASNLILFDITWIGASTKWICRPFQRVAGSFTGLAALVDPVVVLGADKVTPFTLRLSTVGQAGQIWVNGVSQTTWATLINAGALTATRVGLMGADADAVRFDTLTVSAG